MMRIYPQITPLNAGFKPVEFDQFGIIHPSEFIINHSPVCRRGRPLGARGLGYGE
jgi:hypothetical protein